MWTKVLTTQRGAMFSMDARIALVVASVLAVSIGGMQMSRIERTKIENTDIAADLIIKGIEAYYLNTGITTVPATWANVQTLVFDAGFVENQSINVDAWGTAWRYDVCSVNNVMIDGVRVPTVHYIALYSPGKDGVYDSGAGDFLPNATCAASYGAWTPANDDIGRKFSTLDIEKRRVELYRRQAQEISTALTALEGRMFIQNQQFCGGLTPAAAAATARCNFDLASGYTAGEEANYNYYPKSSVDTTAGRRYYVGNNAVGTVTGDARVAAGGTFERNLFDPTAAAGSSASMETLMQLLNLPTTHAVDPWNRRLRYDSNVTGSTVPPYSAAIEFCTNPGTPATCG
jgi:hypothetical protein